MKELLKGKRDIWGLSLFTNPPLIPPFGKGGIGGLGGLAERSRRIGTVPKYIQENRGWTLIELTIVMIIIGIILGYAIPQYRETFEQTRVDLAATNLISIWTAQRLYWAENRTFAPELDDLQNAELFSPKFVENINKPNSAFLHYMVSADDSSFEAFALRRNSGSWNGFLTIDEQGTLGGQVTGSDGTEIKPTQM